MKPPSEPSPPASSRSQLFTVRVWQETSDGERPAWRFKVTHVMSGETGYFYEWQGLVEFLMSHNPLCGI
jgi:hypothetical protein